jgi:hypothetical protein
MAAPLVEFAACIDTEDVLIALQSGVDGVADSIVALHTGFDANGVAKVMTQMPFTSTFPTVHAAVLLDMAEVAVQAMRATSVLTTPALLVTTLPTRRGAG